METFSFYSYKGGAGRSLLLAKAARFLASLGKGVVALDFDLEAPGLHYMLSRSRSGELGKPGGAVPYLVAAAPGADFLPPLEEHIFEIPVPASAGGWLRLMPAGSAPDRRYWAALKQLGELVDFDDPSGQGVLLLLDLHARIEEELKPDYLLIDVRAGVTELGGLATTILADTVVCLFAATPESLDGTLTVIEAVTATPRLKGQNPGRIVPVLAQAMKEPPNEELLAAGVKRLLKLVGGSQTDADEEGNDPRLLVLPDAAVYGAGVGFTTTERPADFDKVYRLFQEIFSLPGKAPNFAS